MLRLGSRVRYRGQIAMIVARTMTQEPTYDLRLADDSLVRYVPATDFDAIESAAEGSPSDIRRL